MGGVCCDGLGKWGDLPPRTVHEKLGKRWEAERKVVVENFDPVPGKFILDACPCMLKLVCTQAPTPEKFVDSRTTTGESPYTFETIAEGHAWTVMYKHQINPELLPIFWGPIAKDKKKRQGVLARCDGAEERAQIEKDLANLEECLVCSNQEVEAGALLNAGFWMINSMHVFRMKSGGLLLYNPIKIDAEVTAWLGGLGTVEWVVAPNALHTSWSIKAKTLFPDAKVVSSSLGAMKLANGKLQVDFNFTSDPDKLAMALHGDFEVLPVPGHPYEELLLIHSASRTLCMCDLVYKGKSVVEPSKDYKDLSVSDRLLRKAFFFKELGNFGTPLYQYVCLYPREFFMPTSFKPPVDDAARVLGQFIEELIGNRGWDKAVWAHINGNAINGEVMRNIIAESWQFALEEHRESEAA